MPRLPQPRRLEPVGHDLTGPSRDRPLASDDDPEAPRAPLWDLSVSGIEIPASLRPPPVSWTSAEHDRFVRKRSHG